MTEMMNAMKKSMEQHWGMTPEFFEAHTPGSRDDLNEGWFTLEFNDVEGNMVFWVESDMNGEVWNTNFEEA